MIRYLLRTIKPLTSLTVNQSELMVHYLTEHVQLKQSSLTLYSGYFPLKLSAVRKLRCRMYSESNAGLAS